MTQAQTFGDQIDIALEGLGQVFNAPFAALEWAAGGIALLLVVRAILVLKAIDRG